MLPHPRALGVFQTHLFQDSHGHVWSQSSLVPQYYLVYFLDGKFLDASGVGQQLTVPVQVSMTAHTCVLAKKEKELSTILHEF